MRFRLFFSVLAVGVLAGLVAAGCGGDDDVDAGNDAGNDSGDDTSEPGTIPEGTFLSESVTQDGEPWALVPGTQIELVFRDDNLSATAGCNHLSFGLTIESDRLVVADDAETTLMGCDTPRHDQDDWLASVLSADPTYELDGERLTLESDGTVIVLVQQTGTSTTLPPETTTPPPESTLPPPATIPPPLPLPPLEGAVWELEGIVSGDSIATLAEGTGATVVFRDGRVEVQIRNCNQGSGPVTIGAAEMEFGPLVSTKMGCMPPAADVEASVFSTLQGTVAYTVEGSLLTLTQQSGMGLMFRGATP